MTFLAFYNRITLITQRVNHTFDNNTNLGGLSHVVTHGGGGRVAARRGRSLKPSSSPSREARWAHNTTTISQAHETDRPEPEVTDAPDVYVVGTAAAVRSVALVVLLLRRVERE